MFNRTKDRIVVAAFGVAAVVFGGCAVGAAMHGALGIAVGCGALALLCAGAGVAWAWFPDIGMP
jgi:hypothetical protein